MFACACHSCLDCDATINRDTVRHNMLLLLHIIPRSKSEMFFINLELIIFPVQLGSHGYGSQCIMFSYANMNVTLFRISDYQISVFSIKQQSRSLYFIYIVYNNIEKAISS